MLCGDCEPLPADDAAFGGYCGRFQTAQVGNVVRYHWHHDATVGRGGDIVGAIAYSLTALLF